MDRQQMESCLERVAAYRASGQTAKVWAEANDVPMRAIASWCAHARRWQARLEGASAGPATAPRPSGFVAARVAPSAASASVRLELNAGGARLDLHWPLAHTRELASLLRELGR
ncbi:IS66 family insertion sequence element accessory protein TnpA [Rhodoferax sediminis]